MHGRGWSRGVGEGTCEQNPGSHAKQSICVCTMLAQCSPPLRRCFMSRSLLPLSFSAVSFSVKPSWSEQINVDPRWICPRFLYVTWPPFCYSNDVFACNGG